MSQLSSDLSNINVYVDDNGELHYVDKDGADSVLPFKRGAKGTFLKGANGTIHTCYCGFIPSLIGIMDTTGRRRMLIWYNNDGEPLEYNAYTNSSVTTGSSKITLTEDGFTASYGDNEAYVDGLCVWFAVK